MALVPHILKIAGDARNRVGMESSAKSQLRFCKVRVPHCPKVANARCSNVGICLLPGFTTICNTCFNSNQAGENSSTIKRELGRNLKLYKIQTFVKDESIE